MDTGAEVSVLPIHILRTCNIVCMLKAAKVSLVVYGSKQFKIKPIGKVSLLCIVGNHSTLVDFVVVDGHDQLPLLGLSDCLELYLIKRVANISKAPTLLFRSISLKREAVSHIRPPSRVPKALMERLKVKLQQLEAQGVIRKIEEPTE